MVYICHRTGGEACTYPTEKIRDTRRWLCAGGKHTATCDRVANFFLWGGVPLLVFDMRQRLKIMVLIVATTFYQQRHTGAHIL